MRAFFSLLSIPVVITAMGNIASAQVQHVSYAPAHTAFSYPSNYTVNLNQSQMIRLPEAASAVIVGNPGIADVSVHSNQMLFLLGRGYGQTNLIILNSAGGVMMESDIIVTSSTQNSVRVHLAGQGRNSYSCHPYCVPAPMLGDSQEFTGAFQADTQPINNTVASGSSSLPSEIVGASVEMSPPQPYESNERANNTRALH